MRLTAFLQGDFGTLLDHWVCDRNKVLRKDLKPQSYTKERRVQLGIKLIIQDSVRRGLRLVEGNGKALAEAVFGQMIDKHPQHEESLVPPVRPTDRSENPALQSLRTVTLAVDPKVSVGPRGFPVVLRASTCCRKILRPRGQRRLRRLRAARGALS